MIFRKVLSIPKFLLAKINSREGLRKMSVNFGWLLGEKIVKFIVGIFVFSWIARFLGPEKLGLWNYALAFVAMIAPLATLGLNNIVVKELVRNPEKAVTLVGTTFILKLIGGFFTFIVSVIAISYIRPDQMLSRLFVAIVGLSYIFQSFDAIDLYYQSHLKSKYTVIAKNAAFLIISATKITLVLLEAPLIMFVISGVVEFLLAAIFLISTYHYNNLSIFNWRFDLTIAKKLLNDSWPLVISSVSITLQAYIDQVMLGDMVNDSELGQYAVAIKLIEVLGFIPVIIQSSVAPEIAKAKQNDEKLYLFKMTRVYQIMFFLFVCTGMPLFLFSDFIVAILFGEAYKAAGVILGLLSIRLFFSNFGVARTLFLTNDNLFKYALFTSIGGSLMNVGFNYLLIPQYASVGAIWSSIISFTFTIFIIDAFYGKARNNFKSMIKAIIDFRAYYRLAKDIFKK